MVPQNNYNSTIKDHGLQIIVTNIVIMKTFEIFQELPICNKETRSEQMLLVNGADRLVQHRVATNHLSVKSTIFAKHNKTRNAYTPNCLFSMCFLTLPSHLLYSKH